MLPFRSHHVSRLSAAGPMPESKNFNKMLCLVHAIEKQVLPVNCFAHLKAHRSTLRLGYRITERPQIQAIDQIEKPDKPVLDDL